MKRKVKVKMNCIATLLVDQKKNGDLEIEEIKDIIDITGYEIIDFIY